jgi:metal-responsive CopG/Arc/MetJ family transcriptional regulator
MLMDRFTISLDEELAREFDAWIAGMRHGPRRPRIRSRPRTGTSAR